MQMWNSPVAMLVATQPLPEPFSGIRSDYTSFKSCWMRHKAILEMSGPLPDSFLLARIEPILDSGSRAVLKSELERNPAFTHMQFWNEMDKTFQSEGPISTRQAWEELSPPSSGKLTPQVWRQFVADFRRLQHRVPDTQDGEAVRLLRQRLPERVAERVEAEYCSRKRNSRQVSILNLGGTEADIIPWFVALTGSAPKSFSKGLPDEWKVDCCHEAQKQQILAYNGRVCSNGSILRVSPTDFVLTSDDIIGIVSEYLEQRQRCDDYRKPPRRPVQQVTTHKEEVNDTEGEEQHDQEVSIAAVAGPPNRGSAPASSTGKGLGGSTPKGGVSVSKPSANQPGSKENWNSRRKKYWAKKGEKGKAQDSPSYHSISTGGRGRGQPMIAPPLVLK